MRKKERHKNKENYAAFRKKEKSTKKSHIVVKVALEKIATFCDFLRHFCYILPIVFVLFSATNVILLFLGAAVDVAAFLCFVIAVVFLTACLACFLAVTR